MTRSGMSCNPLEPHVTYVAQTADNAVGLYFFRSRYYDPQLARFVSADQGNPNPFDPQDLNRFAYVRNNPLGLIDPSGYSFWSSLTSFFTNPVVDVVSQLVGGPIFAAIGTYGLTQSSTGQDILAGEVFATTVAASIYCGGCGVAVGAALGEAQGAYSAYEAKGNILSGTLVGGAIGAGTGELAGSIPMPSTTWAGTPWQGFASWQEYVNAGAIRGAISGLGNGAIQAFAGGKGNIGDIVRGAVTGEMVGALTGAAVGAANYYLDKSDLRVYWKFRSPKDLPIPNPGNNGGPLQFTKPSASPLLAAILKFVPVGTSGVDDMTGYTIVPSVDQLLFKTMPAIFTYGVPSAVANYFVDHPKQIPSFSVSDTFRFK
jgi:RHS repeat-associated protein